MQKLRAAFSVVSTSRQKIYHRKDNIMKIGIFNRAEGKILDSCLSLDSLWILLRNPKCLEKRTLLWNCKLHAMGTHDAGCDNVIAQTKENIQDLEHYFSEVQCCCQARSFLAHQIITFFLLPFCSLAGEA